MTKRRINKLLKDLNIPENSVYIPDTKKILADVNTKVAKHEKEKKKHKVVSFAFSRAMAIAVIVILMLALTTVAFGQGGVFRQILTIFEEPETEAAPTVIEETEELSNEVFEAETELETEIETEEAVNPNYQSAIFDKYYEENPEEAKEYMLNIYDSVEDDNYNLILNEVLGDSKNLYITVTVEAKNNEANELLRDETYGWFKVEAYDEELGWVRVSGGTDEVVNQRRENSRSYTMHIFGDSMLKNGYEKLRVTCRAFSPDMEGDRYVYFEMEKQEDVIEFELSGQSFEGGYIYITPMSIELTAPKEPTAEYAPDARNLNTFFKFKNGSIRTFNQIAGFDGGFSYMGGSNKLYKFQAGTKTVIDIENLESVIVKGIEYPIENPYDYRMGDVPGKYKPFVVNGSGISQGDYYYPCSLNQLSPCIEITSSADGCAEFTYGGKRYSVETDNINVLINGKTNYTLHIPPYCDENGEMWVGMDFLAYLLGIRCDEIGQTGTYLMVP